MVRLKSVVEARGCVVPLVPSMMGPAVVRHRMRSVMAAAPHAVQEALILLRAEVVVVGDVVGGLLGRRILAEESNRVEQLSKVE
jgi:hypothetical protein